MAAAGESAGDIASTLTARARDIDLYVGLDTLEYLKRGGRISGPRAAIGTMLQVKPIITVRDGQVEQADRVRTRSKVRARVIELLTAQPVERIAILHTMSGEVDAFRDELVARLTEPLAADRLTIQPIGPSVGPHLGPGALGGVVLRRH
jgi:DegV family protein with EDD domain